MILTDNKPFFLSTSKELCKKIVKMSRNNDYTTGSLLDFSYHQNYHKLIGIDLSGEANTSILQQINYVGKLEKDDGATMFFVSKNQEKTIVNFSLDLLIVTE